MRALEPTTRFGAERIPLVVRMGFSPSGPSVPRRRADGQARVPRTRVSARDRAHFAAGQDALSAKPRPPVAHRRCAPARHRGCVLFGYFLLHKQEKVTRPPGRRTKPHKDVSLLSRNAKRKKIRNNSHPNQPKHERHQNLRQPPSTNSTNHIHKTTPHTPKKQKAPGPTLLKPPMRG